MFHADNNSSGGCIRGHRSTRCAHADGRILLPVRKPGRPLSACPHIPGPGGKCRCGTIIAAIPRNQKCPCGTNSGTAPVVTINHSTSLPTSTPAMPSPPKHVFRVQKSYSSLSPTPTTQGLSYDINNLDRVNSDSYNIASSQAMAIMGPQPVDTVSSLIGNTATMGPQPVDIASSLIGNMATMGPQPVGTASSFVGNIAATDLAHNGLAPHLMGWTAQPQFHNMPNQSLTPMGYSAPDGSNGFPATVIPFASGMNSSFTAAMASSFAPMHGSIGTPSSSSSSNNGNFSHSMMQASVSPEVQHLTPGFPAHEIQSSAGVANTIMPIPIYGNHHEASSSGMNTHQATDFTPPPEATIFVVPTHCGTYDNPLQPRQWLRDNLRMMVAPPSENKPTAVGVAGNMSPPDSISEHDTLQSCTLHSCSCGPTCQCVGCLAHLDNAATHQAVNSAHNITDEGSSPTPNNNITGGHTNINDMNFSPIGDPQGIPNGNNENPAGPSDMNEICFTTMLDFEGMQNSSAGNVAGTGEDSMASLTDTPDGPDTDNLVLPTENFFWAAFPVDDQTCNGDADSCQCSPECHCVGCLIHNMEVPPLSSAPLDFSESAPSNVGGAEPSGTIAHTGESSVNEIQSPAKKNCCKK
jgi:hypothetical protein